MCVADVKRQESNSCGRDSRARRDVGTLRLNRRGLATSCQLCSGHYSLLCSHRCIRLYRASCIADWKCNRTAICAWPSSAYLLETELRCLPSSQLGSQLRTRPRAHDRCLLTYPAILSLNSVLQRQPFREELRFSSRIANRPQLDEICSTTFSTVYAHLFTCHAFTNTFNYLHVVRKQEDCIRLDCNRDAPRLNYCQLERIHARARVDMSMLATGKTALRVESGLIVRPSLSLGGKLCRKMRKSLTHFC